MRMRLDFIVLVVLASTIGLASWYLKDWALKSSFFDNNVWRLIAGCCIAVILAWIVMINKIFKNIHNKQARMNAIYWSMLLPWISIRWLLYSIEVLTK